MEKVGICLYSLFNKFGGKLSYGEIKNSDVVFFDFYNESGVLSCMDGEECVVESKNGEYVVLVNQIGENDVKFKLSLAEFDIATFTS